MASARSASVTLSVTTNLPKQAELFVWSNIDIGSSEEKRDEGAHTVQLTRRSVADSTNLPFSPFGWHVYTCTLTVDEGAVLRGDAVLRLSRIMRSLKKDGPQPADVDHHLLPEHVTQGSAAVTHNFYAALENRTPTMSKLELLRCMVLTLLLVPVLRVLAIVFWVAFMIVWLFTVHCIRRCCRSRDAPEYVVSSFTRVCLWPAQLASRMLLVCLGFYHIRERVVPAPGQPVGVLERMALVSGVGNSRIIVATHHSWVENLYWCARFPFSFVAKKEVGRLPIIGRVIRGMSPILVDRDSDDSKRDTRAAIEERATYPNDDANPVLVYPMGTVCNQAWCLQFTTGAFAPMQPVTPVLVRYPYYGLDPSWDRNVLYQLFRMLTSVYMSMTVVYLPVQYPELGDKPRTYANRVRDMMSQSVRDICKQPCSLSNLDYKDAIQFLDAREDE